jgi:putative SOS response-associated peptidase YedK
MCNLYSITRSQEAIRRAFRVMRDRTGNLPSLPGIFPDTLAPVVRNGRDGERELTMMRWGFPPPPNFGTVPVTNVRNLKSPYWRGWLKARRGCLLGSLNQIFVASIPSYRAPTEYSEACFGGGYSARIAQAP